MLHLLLLAASIVALGAAGARWSARLVEDLAPRLLGAAAVAAGLAVCEALLLGEFGIGSSPAALTGASVATYVVVRLVVAPPVLPVRSQVAARWPEYSPLAQAAMGGAVLFAVGVAAFQMWRPAIGIDGLMYHASQPAIWVHGGDPGSMHQTAAGFPTQAYPKTMEVLVGWTYSLSRTPIGAVPLTVGLSVLAAAGVVVGLRRVRVDAHVAVLVAAAGLLLPMNLRETSGIFTDLPALAWMVCSVAVSLYASSSPGAIGLAAMAGGLAIGTKPTAAPFVLLAIGCALWTVRDRWRDAARLLAAPVGIGLFLGAVWYVADWYVYGAPLWPFSRFPSGPPIPPFWTTYGGRFLDHPVGSLRSIGWDGLLADIAGAVVLVAATPVVMALAVLPRARPVRRAALLGGIVVLLDLLLWTDTRFTGLASNGAGVIATGLRYITPVPLAAAVVLGLVTRARTFLRPLAILVLLGALGVDVWKDHSGFFGFPFRPDLARCVAIIVAGAVAGLLVARLGDGLRTVSAPWVLPALAVVAALVATVPADDYVSNYLLVTQRHGFTDVDVLRYLSQQPGWQHGHAPVAAGYVAYATLAGPHFEHPLSFIPDDEPCAQVRAAALRGWVVLQPSAIVDYLRSPRCMAGIPPSAELPQGIRVYAPPGFVTVGG